MRTRRWPVVQAFALALLIALGGLLRPVSCSALAASAEGAHNGSPAAVDEIRETTIANLRAGLDSLAGDVQRKIDNDIDITASAFWSAYDLEQSQGAKNGFGSILTAINVGITPLRNLSSIAEQLPQIAASGKWLSLTAYVVSLGAIKEAGSTLDWEINGPAYTSGIKNMYQHAGEAGGEDQFKDSVKTSLQKIVWVRAPQAERDRGVPTITYGTKVLLASFTRRIEALKTRLSDQSIDPSRLQLIVDGLPTLHANIIESQLGGSKYPLYRRGTQQVSGALTVGSIAELRKVQGQLLDKYDAAQEQREATVVVGTGKAAGGTALLNLTFRSAHGLSNVQTDILMSDGLSWEHADFAFKTDVRGLVADIPPQIVFSLSSEFSNIWHMMDAALSDIEEVASRKAPASDVRATPSNPSRPTTDDIRGAVEGEVRVSFKGGLQVLDIHKTDGQSGQWLGAPTYTLEFWVLTEATHSLCVETVWHTWAPSPESQFCSSTEPVLRAGAKYALAGTAHFTMKESGWVLTGVSAADILNAVHCTGTAQINGVEHTYEALGSPLGGSFIIDQKMGIAFTLFSAHPAAARIDIARHMSEPLAYVGDGDRPDVDAMLRNAMSRPGENWTLVPLKAPSCRTRLEIGELYLPAPTAGNKSPKAQAKPATPPFGRACVFYAPNVKNVAGLIGHVGWAFRDGTGDKWVFGATENTNGTLIIDPGDPTNTQSWSTTGAWAQVLRAFGTGDHQFNTGPNYYQNYRCVNINASDPVKAKGQANFRRMSGYNIVFDNCLTKSVDILRAYGVTDLPPACQGTPVCVSPVLPLYYFPLSLTDARFEPSQSIPASHR